MDKLAQACEVLKIDPALVIGSRVSELLNELYILVDCGIGGVKKYTVDLATLPDVMEVPEPTEDETPMPEPPKRKGRKAGK